METLLSLLDNPMPIIVGVILFLIALAAIVAIFGRETVTRWAEAVWKSRRGGSNLLAIMLILPMAACASFFPQTDRNLKAGNIAAALGTGLAEGRRVVVSTCSFLDAKPIVWTVDIAGHVSNQSELIKDTREDRKAVCDALGGSANTSVEVEPAETE